MRDCIKRIVEKSNGALNAGEAKALMDDIDRLAKRAMNGGLDRDEAIDAIVRERAEIVTRNVAKEKANIARNVVIKSKLRQDIAAKVEAGMTPKQAFQSLLERVNSPVAGATYSLDNAVDAIHHLHLSGAKKKLDEAGLMELFNSDQFDDSIGEGMWSYSGDKSPTAGNKQTQEAAKILHDTLEGLRLEMNQYGADIERVEGYMLPQRHDLSAMQKAGRDKWANDMIEWLDPERTFGGDYDDLFDALRGAYDAMISGTRLDSNVEPDVKLFQFSGPANLAKKLSQSRKLHFKDYASWQKWNETYGSRNLRDGFLDAVQHQAANLALLKRFGTNPEAMLKAVANDFKKTYRGDMVDKGVEGLDKFLDGMINYAMGHTRHPASATLARYGGNIRMWMNVTKLGGSLLASIPGDTFTKAMAYQYNGKTFLSSYAQAFGDIASTFKGKQLKEFLDFAGLIAEDFIGNMGGRFSQVDDLSSKAAKLQRLYFKFIGQTDWTDRARGTFQRTMSNYYAAMKDLPFDKLDVDTQRTFGNHNITAKDWDVIRAATEVLSDGREYVGVDNIKDMEVALKLNGLLIDIGEVAVLNPGARERRLASFGLQRGTAAGEAMALLMQFKTFPITAATKVWGRALAGKGKADVPAMIQLVIMSAVFGYIVGMAKDLVKGRSPKDPTKPETIMAALAAGGGLGIFGDVLLQDGTFGRPFTSAMMGPAFGTLDEAFKIYSMAKKGEFSEASALRFGVGQVPLNNHFMLRPAIDQMFLLAIQEELSPGYLRRMEQNMQKTYGQELLYK